MPTADPDVDLAVVAQYTQDRYESARAMLSEFRNWARQLALKIAAAIGVLITIATLLLSVLIRRGELGPWTIGVVVVWGLVLLYFLVKLLFLYELAVKLGYEIVPFVTPRDTPEVVSAWAKAAKGDEGASKPSIRTVVTLEYVRARQQRIAECDRVAKALVAIRDRFIRTLFVSLGLTLGLAVLITCMASSATALGSGAGRVQKP